MQDKISHFTVDEKTYPLAFTLNVLEAIQKEYGSYEKWGKLTDSKEKETNLEALIFGIREMINEGIDIENENNENNENKQDFLTHKQVGRIITKLGLKEVAQTMNEVVVDSTKVEEKPKNV